jgi:RNA polymerase sigma-70 factor (ECF subfamily)
MTRAPDERLQSLITDAAHGDRRALDALLAEQLPSLRAYIRLRMGPRVRRWETESDVAQSVCLEALRNLDGFTYRGQAAFRQWLFTAARRKLAQKDRRMRTAKRDVDRLVTGGRDESRGDDPAAREIQRALGSPSEIAIRRETMRRIEEALDGMSEEAREIVLLSRLAGLTSAEIAAKVGLSASSVRSTLCRALARLAQSLA